MLLDVKIDLADGKSATEFFNQAFDLQLGLGGGFCGHL